VVCTDLSPSAPAELWLPLASVAKQYDTVVTYLPCDVTNEENVASTFAKAKSTSRNPIRGLVTCAGISGRCPAVDYPIETFRKIVDINLTGTFISATAAAKIMHRQNVSGSIVMFASMSGTNVNKVCRSEYRTQGLAFVLISG
jgi:NAD(P)-dependent dehydrogenase (short-subunit alcohol dehydrogenase family)